MGALNRGRVRVPPWCASHAVQPRLPGSPPETRPIMTAPVRRDPERALGGGGFIGRGFPCWVTLARNGRVRASWRSGRDSLSLLWTPGAIPSDPSLTWTLLVRARSSLARRFLALSYGYYRRNTAGRILAADQRDCSSSASWCLAVAHARGWAARNGARDGSAPISRCRFGMIASTSPPPNRDTSSGPVAVTSCSGPRDVVSHRGRAGHSGAEIPL